MPLKIYYDHKNPICPNHKYHSIYINSEINDWILTDNISEADVVPGLNFTSDVEELTLYLTSIKNLVKPNQILMILSLFHSDDWMSPSYYRNLGKYYFDVHPRTIIAHTNTADDSIDPRFICHNLVFNRQKFYMTETRTDPNLYEVAWLLSSFPEMFSVTPVTEKPFDKHYKHVLCPNRILWDMLPEQLYTGRNFFKNEIRNLLLSTDPAKYYLSDPKKGIAFKSNGWDERLNETGNPEHMPPITNCGTWIPIADYYYKTSYASIFVESNHGIYTLPDMVVSPTEKHFDPLIKGHFTIGYGSPGTIKCLREKYGFKFPDWIDYSYDNINNTDERFEYYLESVKNFLNIPLEKLHELYVKDIDILKHNQRLFFDKPYYSLHDNIQNSIKRLGW